MDASVFGSRGELGGKSFGLLVRSLYASALGSAPLWTLATPPQ